MAKNVKDVKKKKGTYSAAKDETSGGGGGSSSSFWDKLKDVILPKGGGR